MENIYVADIQFFRDNNKNIILKSLSLSKLSEEGFIEHYIFKPPYLFEELTYTRRIEANHVSRNFHQIHWDDGFIEYKEHINILTSTLKNASEVLVKGNEKVKYLNNLLGKKICYNVENLSCPNLKNLKSMQATFSLSPVSYQNTSVLKVWLKNLFFNSAEYIERSIQKHNDVGFFALTEKDCYFLPVSVIIKNFSVDCLKSILYKLPPHTVFNHYIQNYIMDSNKICNEDWNENDSGCCI
uniref:Uncharacterized protein n=1 Tax=Cacopsylla melanoneura TaxID=428564 RepID=A0A8D8WD36_9HEMI